MSGLDRLCRKESFPYPGSKVGLLCHHASQTKGGRHAVHVLAERPEWTLTCLFTPEHGFSGTAAAGEKVGHSVHKPTNLPIYSLYGADRAPRTEWVDSLDLMVIDLKDLGVRCYTYASTLLHTLMVCARAGVRVLVLDRKTPLAGMVDGPELDPDCTSFVGMIPLPLVYGQSQGALARTLQEKIPALIDLRLDVIEDTSGISGPWIPPSPAIVSPDAARCYPATVWCEAIPDVWVDRGGPDSFQVWAMPDFPSNAFEKESMVYGMNLQQDEFQCPSGIWPGLRLRVVEESTLKPASLAHFLLERLCSELGSDRLFDTEGSKPGFFDKLAGTRSWRECLMRGVTPDFIAPL